MNNQMQNILSYTKSTSLLYVEDNEEARGFTLELLNRFFDNISVAINGQEGLELFNTKKFDLIITDINMPVMGGMEMIRKIRTIDIKIPIFILSAHNEAAYLEASNNISICEYLEKPLNLKELIDTLDKISMNMKKDSIS